MAKRRGCWFSPPTNSKPCIRPTIPTRATFSVSTPNSFATFSLRRCDRLRESLRQKRSQACGKKVASKRAVVHRELTNSSCRPFLSCTVLLLGLYRGCRIGLVEMEFLLSATAAGNQEGLSRAQRPAPRRAVRSLRMTRTGIVSSSGLSRPLAVKASMKAGPLSRSMIFGAMPPPT